MVSRRVMSERVGGVLIKRPALPLSLQRAKTDLVSETPLSRFPLSPDSFPVRISPRWVLTNRPCKRITARHLIRSVTVQMFYSAKQSTEQRENSDSDNSPLKNSTVF